MPWCSFFPDDSPVNRPQQPHPNPQVCQRVGAGSLQYSILIISTPPLKSHQKCPYMGVPWQSSGQDLASPLLAAGVQSLVGQLRSCKPCHAVKNKSIPSSKKSVFDSETSQGAAAPSKPNYPMNQISAPAFSEIGNSAAATKRALW